MSFDKLLKLTKCLLCKETYEDPIILPCHSTICSKHVTENTSLECLVCNLEHTEPQNGFKSDVKTIELITTINQFISQIEFGSNNREANLECIR